MAENKVIWRQSCLEGWSKGRNPQGEDIILMFIDTMLNSITFFRERGKTFC